MSKSPTPAEIAKAKEVLEAQRKLWDLVSELEHMTMRDVEEHDLNVVGSDVNSEATETDAHHLLQRMGYGS